jgi:hypothetical protein
MCLWLYISMESIPLLGNKVENSVNVRWIKGMYVYRRFVE